jgi:periplasmic protein TonB
MPEALESPLSRAAVAAEMASFPPTDHAATQPRPASEPADPIHKIETTRLPAFDRSVKAVETPLPERPLDQGSVSSSSESLFESFRADNAKRESEVESSEATRNERHLVFANLAASKSSPVVWSTRIRVAVLLILLVAGLYVASNRLSFVYKEKGALRPAIKTAPAPQKEQSLPAEAEILPATPSLPRSSAEVEETSPAPAPPPAVESGSSEQHIPSLPDVSNKTEEDSGLEETPNVPEVTISDVTGSVSGPYLRDGKYPPLPAEAIRSLGEKALVLRVVVNRTGEVVEVTPLTPDGKSAASPESVLAAVRKWRFTPLRRKDEATAVKYYSFKVESQPR